ncbi:hypothetical protein HLH33_08580 [Gluconacetobacter diazotrophicus]|uniref:Uncharacterized protein n=1 Tax=Gluconacetobacter diazotrophicus TaxID=33996 RepID=A0A7W4I5J2_GLUDI|nr:hypothetical protein [Gluconacetobacter diazotrophicus]MBB2156365.1 hypothetical protein [Gluconacetobacter diazotrophicus]
MKKIAIFLVAFMCQIQLSKADDINSCISAALSLPLLGGKSDTPIIPVKVNGINVAMYVSPDFFGGLYMREGGNFSLRPGRIQGTITENDVRKFPAEVTSLDSLDIGGAVVDSPLVFRMPGYVTQSIDGRPLVGVIGDSVLSNFQVLIDMPHGRFALLKVSHDDSCARVEKSLLGDNVDSVPMKGDRKEIPVKIDGVEKLFALDADSSVMIVPPDWRSIPELDRSAVAKGQRIVMHYVDGVGIPGRKVVVRDMRVSHEDMSGTPVIVQDVSGAAALGTPFFANHIVLIDYDRSILFFSRSDNLVQSPGHHLHFEENTEGQATVKE